MEDSEPPQLHVEAGRHPVVELLLEGSGSPFVPNDTHLQVHADVMSLLLGAGRVGLVCHLASPTH